MNRIIYILLLGFFAFIGNSCQKKTNEETTTPSNTTPVTSATIETASATPGDIISVKFDAEPSQSTYQIKVGTTDVSLIKVNTNEYQFILPVTSPGATTVDLNSVGLTTPVTLVIDNYQTITDPEPVIAEYKDKLEAAVKYTQKYSYDTLSPVPYESVLMIQGFRDNINAIFAQLTKEEKIEAAYFIQKIKLDTFDFYSLRKEPLSKTSSPFKIAAGDRSNRFVTIGECFVTSVTGVVAGVAICIAGIAAPEPTPVTKIIGLVAGAGAAISAVCANKFMDMLATEFGVQFSFENLLATKKLAAGASASELSFTNNIPLNVQFNSNYRRVLTSDESGSSTFIKGIFSSINIFKEKYNSFIDGINKITSWFPLGKPIIPPFISKVKTSIVSRTIPTPSENLTLNNVSDPQIKVTYTKKGNTLDIIASSTTVTTAKSFTFDVVYENTELGITTKKTVTADFDPVTCKLFGNWKITEYDMYGNDLLNGDYYTTVLGGCANSFNNYTIYYKYDNWTLKFNTDGTFENIQYFSSGSYKEFVPNAGIVCKDRSTANLYTKTATSTFDYNYFNNHNTLVLPINRVYHAVADVYMEDAFTVTLLDDNTLQLSATYNGYTTKIVLKRQ